MTVSRCLPVVAVALLAAGPAAAAEKVELKVVKYAALGEAVRQHKGKVVLVDFWSTY
jgi:hypothetical protein